MLERSRVLGMMLLVACSSRGGADALRRRVSVDGLSVSLEVPAELAEGSQLRGITFEKAGDPLRVSLVHLDAPRRTIDSFENDFCDGTAMTGYRLEQSSEVAPGAYVLACTGVDDKIGDAAFCELPVDGGSVLFGRVTVDQPSRQLGLAERTCRSLRIER